MVRGVLSCAHRLQSPLKSCLRQDSAFQCPTESSKGVTFAEFENPSSEKSCEFSSSSHEDHPEFNFVAEADGYSPTTVGGIINGGCHDYTDCAIYSSPLRSNLALAFAITQAQQLRGEVSESPSEVAVPVVWDELLFIFFPFLSILFPTQPSQQKKVLLRGVERAARL